MMISANSLSKSLSTFTLTLLLLSISLIQMSWGSCADITLDPCQEGNYEELDDETRSSGYFNSEIPYRSDSQMPTKWYRSISPAGGDMPTAAPDTGYCQSASPIWMDGKSNYYTSSQSQPIILLYLQANIYIIKHFFLGNIVIYEARGQVILGNITWPKAS